MQVRQTKDETGSDLPEVTEQMEAEPGMEPAFPNWHIRPLALNHTASFSHGVQTVGLKEMRRNSICMERLMQTDGIERCCPSSADYGVTFFPSIRKHSSSFWNMNNMEALNYLHPSDSTIQCCCLCAIHLKQQKWKTVQICTLNRKCNGGIAGAIKKLDWFFFDLLKHFFLKRKHFKCIFPLTAVAAVVG